jgi:hypothetical protein
MVGHLAHEELIEGHAACESCETTARMAMPRLAVYQILCENQLLSWHEQAAQVRGVFRESLPGGKRLRPIDTLELAAEGRV